MIGRARRVAAAALLVIAGGGGCAPSLSDLAQFLDTPFADLSAGVTDLDDAEVGAVMDVLMLRFRSYLTLRERIPFDALAPDRCMSEIESGGASFAFVADVACTFGDSLAPAEGTIAVRQEQVADTPPVLRLDADYRDVVVGDLAIDGTEHIDETSADNGASIRALDVVQDRITLKYTFRVGMLDGTTPVFDYALPAPGGTVLARVSNPASVGGFVTVTLTGLDGSLLCEVRDAAWAPGVPARGTCCDATEALAGGACDGELRVFGLPLGE